MRLFGSFLWRVIILHFILGDWKNGIFVQILAKQSDVPVHHYQYQDESVAVRNDCNEHKRYIMKRASDEDVDYEVYQGVVGRPGIDFPIYPRIPKTSFSCRAYGNGYFADMETECQVFHICEEGRKISFLCPNGTIFQQSELTCDWWFKVNCLGSSGYYADSRELLNKQKVQRLKPSVPIKGFNILAGDLDIKPLVSSKKIIYRSQISKKSDRRMDSNENSSVENIDFEDLSLEKSNNEAQKSMLTNVEINNNENESQIAEESSSFVNNRNRDDYVHEKSNSYTTKIGHLNKVVDEHGTVRHMYVRTQFNGDSTEQTRKGVRGSQRYREGTKLYNYPTKRADVEMTSKTDYSKDNRSYKNQLRQQHFSNTTPTYIPGTHSTVRRIENTPFYTPTVPILPKTKSADNKKFYHKTNQKPVSNSQLLDLNSSYFPSLQTLSSTPKISTISNTIEVSTPSSRKPYFLGPNYNSNYTKGMTGTRVSSNFNNKEAVPTYNFNYTTPLTSKGVTYLPKDSSFSKISQESSGDLLLRAPNLTIDDTINRNLNEMVKTMNLLKIKLEDAEVIHTNTRNRTGLDIPSSSGPDALVSLAHYFAAEKNNNIIHPILDGIVKTNKNESPVFSRRTIERQKLLNANVATTPETITIGQMKVDPINSGLLSEKTVYNYSTLFGLKDISAKNTTIELTKRLMNDTNNHFNESVATFPQIGTTDTTLKTLGENPETRQIAQVFSNALSSYLNNPSVFRQQLEAVRPTKPPENRKSYNNYVTTTDEGLLDSTTLFASTSAIDLPKALSQLTTEIPNIAIEINSNFDSSTILPDLTSTTEMYDVTTFNSTLKKEYNLELSAELEPATPESEEGEEFLQHEQSQAFAKPLNDLIKEQNKIKKETGIKSVYNKWNSLAENDYFNPLIINDGLMKERKFKLTTQNPSDNEYNISEGLTPNSTSHYTKQNTDPWIEIFRIYNIPIESLPSSSGLQRIANKLFGGLNENEATHLKNVMGQAENNRQVLNLLLLLIQTCDDQNGKALERSRKHLLNVLINMDEKINSKGTKENVNHKQYFTPITTEKYPVTTYRRLKNDNAEEYTTSSTNMYPSTTLDSLYTTNIPITTLPPIIVKNDQTTQPEIRVVGAIYTPTEKSSDKRALELLKSLYSLAAKFTSTQ